jgi:hypothetical protein
VDRKVCEQRRLRQQGIYPVGLEPLEIVAAGKATLEVRRQRGADSGDTIRRKNTFED